MEEKQLQKLRTKYLGVYKYNTPTNSWYKFEGHHWRSIGSIIVLEACISEMMIDRKDSKFSQKCEEGMRLFQSLLTDPKFHKKRDKKSHLIGFKNGVYDLRRSIFRPGKARDYIVFHTGYDYVEYKETDPTVIEIRHFLSELFVEEEKCKKIIRSISSFLKFRPLRQLHILLGSGSNGKSALMRLIERAFGGHYSIIGRIENTTTGSNVANQTMVNACNKKLSQLSELDRNHMPAYDALKSLIRGKHVYRPLYMSYLCKVRTNLIVCGNEKPSYSGGDPDGLMDIIEMKTQFVENPDPSKPHQKKGRDVRNDIERWAPTFMAILLDNITYKRLSVDLQNDIKAAAIHFKYRCPDVDDKGITGGYGYHESMVEFLSHHNSVDTSIKSKMVEQNYLSKPICV